MKKSFLIPRLMSHIRLNVFRKCKAFYSFVSFLSCLGFGHLYIYEDIKGRHARFMRLCLPTFSAENTFNLSHCPLSTYGLSWRQDTTKFTSWHFIKRITEHCLAHYAIYTENNHKIIIAKLLTLKRDLAKNGPISCTTG